MRAIWALVRLQWVQIWFQPPLMAAVGVVLVWLGLPASVAVGLSLGIGASTAARTGWSIVDGSSRFLFARPVPTSVFVGAAGVVVVLSAAGLWLAGITVELWAGTFRNPAHRLMRLGIMFVVFLFAHLAGATLAGLRVGARVAWLGLVSLVGMLVLFSRFVSLREAFEALPVPAFVGGRWPFWGVVIVSLTTWWVATSRGVQAGRGNPERTMGAMWKALLLGAVVVLTAAGGWVAYLRAAPVERLSRLVASRAVGDQWVMVTGLITDDTLYTPSFLLRPATQAQSRVEGWALWQPSAASADGKVFAAMVQGEGDRSARVHIADVGSDVTWRPAREIGLDYWIPFIALSPSGARLAVWTRSSLTVYDTSTMQPISRIRQSHVPRALCVFADERHVITERETQASGGEREVEVVSVDVERGATTVLGEYVQTSGEEARMDASRRFVAIAGRSPVGQEIRRIDLANPALPATWRIEAAAHVVSAPLPLPDGRVVVVLRSLSRRGTVPRRSAELRVLGDVVTSIPLDDVPNAGLAWLGGERVVAGIRRPVTPGSTTWWADTSVIVDLREARVVSVLPGLRHVGAGSYPFVDPGPTNGTVAFVEHNRRIVLRPDLRH